MGRNEIVMRAEKVVRNIFYDYLGNILTIIVGFISKTVFIYTLGEEYLGLSGLYTNVLTVLSLAELGIGSAITFELYKPLADKNNELLYGLMNFYKKAYKIIGWIVLVIGIMFVPFLKYIIKFESNIDINYTLIYILFLLNSVFSYWFNAYKATILIASQQKYLTKKIEYVLVIIQTIVQVGALFIWHSYVVFLIVGIVRSILQNYLVAQKTDKVFPFLKEEKQLHLEEGVKERIYKNVYAMSLYKVSGVVVNSTDNIIISAFISTNVLGRYSLYNYIIISIKSFLAIIFDSFVAAIGDFNVTETDEKKKQIFDVIFFLTFCSYGMMSVGLVQVSSLFVSLWAGKEYLMRNSTVVLMVLVFLISGLENATYIFRTGCGIYDIAKYRPVISAVLNLVVSIILVNRIGINGVFIGTIVSRMLSYWLVDPQVVYKHILRMPVADYYITYCKYIVILLASTLISQFLSSFLQCEGWLLFIAKGLIAEIIFCGAIFIFYRKTHKYQYLVSSISRIVRRRKG